jgi:hypothetical protein
MSIIEAALHAHCEMATFEEAGGKYTRGEVASYMGKQVFRLIKRNLPIAPLSERAFILTRSPHFEDFSVSISYGMMPIDWRTAKGSTAPDARLE